MNIIISCGGGGTRLWPISTKNHPKQLVALLDEESLLLKTYNRVRKQFSPEQIWLTVNQNYANTVREILPTELSTDHILIEPEKRDNFPAIITAAAIVAGNTNRDEALIFLPCDDWIEKEEDIHIFNQALLSIGESLEKKEFEIITVGVKPAFANPQLGHIEIHQSDLPKSEKKPVPVVSFKEKPDLATAENYLKSGNYLWHKHNPSFTFNSLITNLQKFWPELVEIVEQTFQEKALNKENFSKLPKIAIDPALLEKCENIAVILMNITWEDLGSWEVIYNHLPEIAENSQQIELKGNGNKVKLSNKERKVAFVGVSNLLVIDSPEGLLILNPKESAEVKKIAEYFE